jgi:hypothetical protein
LRHDPNQKLRVLVLEGKLKFIIPLIPNRFINGKFEFQRDKIKLSKVRLLIKGSTRRRIYDNIAPVHSCLGIPCCFVGRGCGQEAEAKHFTRTFGLIILLDIMKFEEWPYYFY